MRRTQSLLRLAQCMLAGCVLATATLAIAKSITITTNSTIDLHDGRLTVHLKVTNSGDDTAESVTPVLRFRGQEIRGSARQMLGPNESFDATLEAPVGEVPPGRWPYQLAIDYTDINQYPFQALQASLLTVGSPSPAKVVVPEMSSPPLVTTGNVTVRVKNVSATVRAATVSLVLPEGLQAASPVATLSLAPWEERAVTVPIVNRSVLAGSRYAIFAAVEYDDDGVHQSVLGRGIVEITAAQSLVGSRQRLLWAAAAVLVVGWLGFVLGRAVRRRAAGPSVREPT
ncbi:MAG TPA: hypothetical protein VKW76_08195 [Candidatus Binatia bacterium]|nr:hypothetical protein [Candidatus Binatia bacterium]